MERVDGLLYWIHGWVTYWVHGEEKHVAKKEEEEEEGREAV